MKILYVIQRYGEDIVGGSESACRSFCEELVRRGHHVEVVTSCARSYVTWEDSYERGTFTVNGVTVHRLPVYEPRRGERFGALDRWLMSETPSHRLFEHVKWAHQMGPDIIGLREWLINNAERFDVAIFMTYLYATATLGIPAVAGRVPVVFQPTAHDEPPMKVPIFESIFRLANSFLFFTPEEREVVTERFRFKPNGLVVGIGIDLNPPIDESAQIGDLLGIGASPYLLYVGRLDPMKGVRQLCDYFVEYKSRFNNDLKLVLAGEPLVNLPQHDDIVISGYLDERTKHAAVRGSVALVQSSYFESFSIVLCEAWVQARPALVQSGSSVLAGQARRSGGAIPYGSFPEFEQAIEMLLENENLAQKMGASGRRYVEENYDWNVVIDGVEQAIRLAQDDFTQRPVKLSRRH